MASAVLLLVSLVEVEVMGSAVVDEVEASVKDVASPDVEAVVLVIAGV